MANETCGGIIKKLPEHVVNKIAAGEVVQRPANVVKELVENCLDAGATQVSVTVRHGGLKLIQVQDNGAGIEISDLPILCERFTTSKLRDFEDLASIGTYGFRGEALASVSHVARLSVLTKKEDNPCAFKAEYSDGKLLSDPVPSAGNRGTTITVEDIFYNMEIRKKALRSSSEEHNRISEIVSRYAIHNANVGFCLKRQGDSSSSCDVKTIPGSTSIQNIGVTYGAKFSNELMEISLEDSNLGFKLSGLVTNPNFSVRKFEFILFINHRLVDNAPMKRALELLYASYVPKTSHPFVYLSLEVSPHHIDVNVHPTKQEVRFLHETSIIERLTEVIENELLRFNQSRVYTHNSVWKEPKRNQQESDGSKKLYDHQLVRTDNREQKLHAFFSSQQTASLEPVPGCSASKTSIQVPDRVCGLACAGKRKSREEEEVEEVYSSQRSRYIQLDSVNSHRSAVTKNASKFLRQVMRDHSFVGCVDPQYGLIQHSTGLYLTDTEKLSEELFYQAILFRFGNFGQLKLEEIVDLGELLKLSSSEVHEETIEQYVSLLDSKSEMLNDYFSLEICERKLSSLPNIISDYTPQLEGLPKFLLSLAEDTNWDLEETCLDNIARHLARFYAFKKGHCREDQNTGLESSSEWKRMVENILYPAFKSKLFPPNEFAKNCAVLKLTDLQDLYKVFERC